MQVIFTQRAFVSILAETAEKIQTETGGIFLGYREADTWYVVEAIDPGPKSTFQVAYFEYDTKYVNHLVNKVARIYNKPLELIGLWHRHPGSFDQFSGTDDGTNLKFATLHKDGAISALVNIDPEFRLTVFHVTAPLAYSRVRFKVGDEFVPEQFRTLCDAQRLLDYSSAKVDSIWGDRKPKLPKYKYDAILNEVIRNLDLIEITNQVSEAQIPNLSDDDISFLIEETEKDLEYFGECYMEFQITLQNKFLCAQNHDNPRQVLQFGIEPNSRRCLFKYGERFYYYHSQMFQYIFDDIIEAMKRVPKVLGFARNLLIDRELIECSLKKLRNR